MDPQTFLYALDECTRENTDYSNLVEYIKKIKWADVHVELCRKHSWLFAKFRDRFQRSKTVPWFGLALIGLN